MRKILQCAAAVLTVAMGLAANVQAQVTTLAEIHRTGTSTGGTYIFTFIPSNTSTDLLNGILGTLVSGNRDGNSAGLGIMTNGVGATSADQPSANFFAIGDCRFVFDLGTSKFIGQINTYSWHRNDGGGDRAPQVYDVYGAPSGATIDNSTLAGYTKIASVDTSSSGFTPISAASDPLGNGGQHGVSISGINTNYRYILFDTFQKAGQSPTFFSEIDAVAAPPAAPTAPTGLTATAPYAGVVLSWTAPAGASSYTIYRSTTSGSGYTQIASAIGFTTYNDSTVTAGTTYYYVVKAVNVSGTSPNSNEASVTPTTAPFVGAGDGLTGKYYYGDDSGFSPLTGTPFLIEVDPFVNFNDHGNDAGYNPLPFNVNVPPTDFTVRWSGLFVSPITGPVTFSTIADDGVRLYVNDTTTPVIYDPFYQGPTLTNSAPIALVAGQKYAIIMDYFQGGGGATAQLLYSYPGLDSTPIPQTQLYSTVNTPPATPTNLTAYAGSAIFLSWTEVDNGSPTPTFNVLRSTTAGGPYTTIATGVTTTAYTDPAVTLGTTYYYVVSATNTYGTSSNSNEASAIPAKPTEVLHYDFESGPQGLDPDPIADITGMGHDGSAFGGDEGFTTDSAHGTYAGIITADTDVQYLALPGFFDFGDQFTFFCNTKLPAYSGITTIFSSHAVFGYGGWSLYVNDNGNMDEDLVLETNGDTQIKATSVPNIFPLGDGLYHAVAAVINRTAGTVDVYYDGTKVISNGFIGSTWPTSSEQELLGTFPPPVAGQAGEFFRIVDAEFDDVRVFNGLLTSAEVAALSGSTATVTGQIALEGVNDLTTISAAIPAPSITVDFRTPGTTGSPIYTATVTLTPVGAGSGFGTYSISGVPSGTYDIAFKGTNTLRVVLPNVSVGGSVSAADVTLPAGDATNDNRVDIGDFGLLVNAYVSDVTDPSSGYAPQPDFDYNGRVDIGDFGLLVNEYGNAGAP